MRQKNCGDIGSKGGGGGSSGGDDGGRSYKKATTITSMDVVYCTVSVHSLAVKNRFGKMFYTFLCPVFMFAKNSTANV